MILSIQTILILLVCAILLAIYKALEYAFVKSGMPNLRRKKMLSFIISGIILWLGILAALAYLGFFQNFELVPPRIALAMLPPTILSLILLSSKTFYKILKTIPHAWLIYIQSIRIIVELILWMGFLAGFVPFQMTFEGLNYDIIVGLTALLAGFTFFGRGRYRRPEAFLWNIFGIVLLLFIVFISIISTPSPLRIFFNEPANTFMAHFPFIWIPGFIVPFALAMHLFSLKLLVLNKESLHLREK